MLHLLLMMLLLLLVVVLLPVRSVLIVSIWVDLVNFLDRFQFIAVRRCDFQFGDRFFGRVHSFQMNVVLGVGI